MVNSQRKRRHSRHFKRALGFEGLEQRWLLATLNDSLTEAIPLAAVTTNPQTVNATISPDTDVNIYRFNVSAGQVVDFDIDTPLNGPGGLGSFLRLFNSQGTELAFNNNAIAPGENTVGFDAYLRRTFTAAGTFFIGVSNANNTFYNPITGDGDTAGGANATGSYQLIVQALPADPDDTLVEAIQLGTVAATPITFSNTINPDIDVDLYRFNVSTGQVVDFDIDTTANGPGGVGSFLRLFNAQGQEIAFNNNAAAPGESTVGFDAYLRFTFATAGTFYIGVSNGTNTLYNPNTGGNDAAGGQFSIGDYVLIVQTAPAIPADPDDSIPEAIALSAISTTPQTVSGGIQPDSDVDLYRFTVAAGQVVDFDIDTGFNGPGGLGSFLRLFNSQGQELAFNDDAIAPGENVVGFDAYLRFNFAIAGTYYVGVSNNNNRLYNPSTGAGDVTGGANSTGSYQLTVQALPVDTDDSLGEASFLGAISTTPAVVNGTIFPDIDVDLYRFTVVTGQVVDFDIDTTFNGPGGLGSFLRLFDSQGTELAFNNNAAAPSESVIGFDAYLRFTFAVGGTYYIGVSNGTNTLYNPITGGNDAAGGQFSIGDYQLIVQTAPVAPADPDDTLVEAFVLGAITTTPVAVSDSIQPDTDVDLYRFTVTAGQVVDFDIDTPFNGPGGLGSFLRLFSSQGQELAFNDDAIAPGENVIGFDAYLRFTFATAGTFYIGVSNNSNTLYNTTTGAGDVSGGANATGSYQLIVQALPVDPDDSLVEAVQLGAITSTPVSRSDSINPDIDVDLYRFTVLAGQVVGFDIDTTANGPGGLGSFLRLFNSQGTELAFNNNGLAPGENVLGFDAYLQFTFATAGTYYIGVSNATNTLYNPTTGGNDAAGGQFSIGDYQLIVRTTPADPDDTADFNDTLAEAVFLGAISTTPAVVDTTILVDHDVDLYRFTVVAGQVVDFDIDTPLNGPGGLGSFLRLFNAQGQEIAFNDNGAAPGESVVGFDAYLRFTFATAGTFYIGVSNTTNTLYNPVTGDGDVPGGTTGSYQLIVQTAPAAPADPDDSLIEAPNLGAITTTPVAVSDSITPDTDVDLYRFTVVAGQVVDFDIDTPFNGPGGLGSFLRLFNAQGQELAFNDNGAAPGESVLGFDAYLRFTFATAGTYYVGVSNANNTLYNATTGAGDVSGGANATGSYQLIVQAILVVPADLDDSLTEAPSLGAISTTPAAVSASITPDIDVDLYRFTVTAGQVVDFDIDTPLNGPGGLGSFLRLFNAQGQELAFNNNAAAPGESLIGFDAYLRFTFATAGTYYIGVSNSNNTLYNAVTGNGDAAGGQDSTGSYQLIVQAVPVGVPTLSLTTNVSSISEQNGTAIGTVARNNTDVSQALVVTLSSSDTGAATVPASVVIPANLPGISFTISAVDSATRGTTRVTITAAAAGFTAGTVSLLVTDNDGIWQNPVNPLDVDNDTFVSPIDAVLVINFLNSFGSGPVPVGNPPPYLDVDGDNFVSPIDAVLVINFLIARAAPFAAAAGEESAPAPATNSSLSTDPFDSYFAELGSQEQSERQRRSRSRTPLATSFAG
jgi:hypothetical protein